MSTLRRRIKENAIGFKLEGGKYLVLDQPQEIVQKTHTHEETPSDVEFKLSQHDFSDDANAASTWQFASKMLEELKAAYSKVLQEKEAQICQLKEEVVDLKMLVKVLEDKVPQQTNSEATDEFVFFDDTFAKSDFEIER